MVGIEWVRDLVIIIFGVVAIAVLIFCTILFYRAYREARSLMHSWKTTSENIRNISSCVGNGIINPFFQVFAIIPGVCRGIDSVIKFFKKEGEKQQ